MKIWKVLFESQDFLFLLAGCLLHSVIGDVELVDPELGDPGEEHGPLGGFVAMEFVQPLGDEDVETTSTIICINN